MTKYQTNYNHFDPYQNITIKHNPTSFDCVNGKHRYGRVGESGTDNMIAECHLCKHLELVENGHVMYLYSKHGAGHLNDVWVKKHNIAREKIFY